MDFLNVLPMVVADSSDAALGAFGLILWLICMAASVLCIVAYWKLYVKMGEPGWACLVPFYSTWLLYKHTWGKGAWMFAMFIPVVGVIFPIITVWKLFKGFGKGTGFCILGLLFSPIALLICAFDSSTYVDQN